VETLAGEGNPERSDAQFRTFDLPKLPRARSFRVAPIAFRLAVLLVVGLIAFKGVQGWFFPPDVLNAAKTLPSLFLNSSAKT
jgi:hypothetical protein